MLRLPAVAGRFYPSDPAELIALIRKYTHTDPGQPHTPVRACLVPHAGYVYSGHVAGAVLGRLTMPRKIIILGVRHYPRVSRRRYSRAARGAPRSATRGLTRRWRKR